MDTDDKDGQPEYPPDTYRWMSWGAIKFIYRPTWRPLTWVVVGLAAVMIAGFAAVFFVRLDVRVEAEGELVADPSVLQVIARTDDLMGVPRVVAGSRVAKGDVLAVLQTDVDEEGIERVRGGLETNVARLSPADPSALADLRIEAGQSVAEIRDAAIRSAASSLQGAIRRLQKRQGDEEREEVIRWSRELRGALGQYLERHRLRSPAVGTVLQYGYPANSNVREGDVVAVILPEGARLVARLSLEAKDVPKVSAGQKVRHRIEAYPFQHYGLFEGEVVSIERAGQEKGELLYEVRATVRNPPALSPRLASEVRLVMGMKLGSQIVIGQRALYDILADGIFGRR